MEMQNVTYLAFESSQARLERINTKLWVVIIILVVALIGSNAGWIYWESQWQYVQTETNIDATQDGDNNYLSGGDMYYGAESESK